jgi:hypothetical protein
LRPRTFSFWWWGRHYRAADSTNAIVDGASVLFDVIVTSQVERLAHALNVPFGKERANVYLKARRFRHCASQVLGYTDVAVSFVKRSFLSLDLRVPAVHFKLSLGTQGNIDLPMLSHLGLH